MKQRVVGLAGGIGGGKSTIASLFRKWGARVIDADAVGHAVLDQPRVRARLVRAWGEAILKRGRVDRSMLARLAFRSRASAARLNRIMHPPILREIRRRLARSRGTVVLDAALLFEAGVDRLCDCVVFVDAARAARIRRTRTRGWSTGELERRERAQWPLESKKRKADYVIENAGPKSRTERQARKIWNDVQGLHP